MKYILEWCVVVCIIWFICTLIGSCARIDDSGKTWYTEITYPQHSRNQVYVYTNCLEVYPIDTILYTKWFCKKVETP